MTWSRPTAAAAASEFEYELLDTGVFDQDRYFDVFVEYAKESPEDILVQITVHNRGPEAAELHVLPTLWFRNRWSWGEAIATAVASAASPATRRASSRRPNPELGERYLYCDGDAPLLFTENETNTQRLFGVAEPHALRQGRHQQLRRPRPDRRRESANRPGRRPRRTTA